MPTSRFLRPLSPNRFQVHIADRVAAVLEVVGRTVKIYTLSDEVHLLATSNDTAVGTAARIADGEFDNDVRFEVFPVDEPDDYDNQYIVVEYGLPSQKELDRHHTGDPGSMIAAYREAQAYTLEERLGEYGLEWQREQEERMGR